MKQIYFSHDCNARNDEKLVKLFKKHGGQGYGIYWMIIEKLHSTEDGYLPTDFETLAYDLRCRSVAKLRSIVLEHDLFRVELNRFTSNRVLRNMKKAAEKREKATVSALVRWNNNNSHEDKKENEEHANALPTQCEGNAIKENKRKEKKMLLGNPKKPQQKIPPSIEEITAYCTNKNSSINPQRFFDYYQANGWRVGKNPMRDWKAAIRTWEGNTQTTKPSNLPQTQL